MERAGGEGQGKVRKMEKKMADEYDRELTIQNVKTGEVIYDDADILISARGNLNDFVWPKIDGFETFKGEVMHSAAWNQSYAPLPFPLPLSLHLLTFLDMISRTKK